MSPDFTTFIVVLFMAIGCIGILGTIVFRGEALPFVTPRHRLIGQRHRRPIRRQTVAPIQKGRAA